MKTFERNLLCLFFRHIFHYTQSTRNSFLPNFGHYLAVHEEPKHITDFRTYRSAWTVLYMENIVFSLIDMCVQYKNN